MRPYTTLRARRKETTNFGFVVRKFRLLLVNRNKKDNLWENPPQASEAMSAIFKEFKHTFKDSDQWDGDFVL